MELELEPTSPADAKPGELIEQRETVVRLRIRDTETGVPLTDLNPMVWIDRQRGEGPTSIEMCRQKIGTYAEGTLRARPAVDLNSYYLLSMTTEGTILVLDPILGFGRTKLLTSIPLGSPTEDWVLSPDGRHLFVSLPEAGKIAVVETDRWKVVTQLQVGSTPTRLALQPESERLWVTLSDGLAVIDFVQQEVVGRVATGSTPHALAFSPDGRLAFALNREAGTLAVIDAQTASKVREVATGPRPADLAVSPLVAAIFVAHEGDGSIAVVDGATLEVTARIQAKPGVRSIRFPTADMHGSHGHGHHPSHGRFGYVMNPSSNEVYVIDAVGRQLVHTIDVPTGPDQVAFTSSFAYLRSARTAEIRMLPLSDPGSDGTGTMDIFAAGFAPPGFSTAVRRDDVIAAAPEMPDAVYVANPKEKMIYYFHYMEGMPVPAGGLTTYNYEPTAIRVVGRNLRETEAGLYAATVEIPQHGEYDVVFFLQDPRVVHCFGFSVQPEPASEGKRVRLAIEPLGERRELSLGENVFRFRLSDRSAGVSRSGVEDLTLQLGATDGWRYRGVARAMEDGAYEIAFPVPREGVYYLSFESPSLGIRLNDRSPLILRAGDASPNTN